MAFFYNPSTIAVHTRVGIFRNTNTFHYNTHHNGCFPQLNLYVFEKCFTLIIMPNEKFNNENISISVCLAQILIDVIIFSTLGIVGDGWIDSTNVKTALICLAGLKILTLIVWGVWSIYFVPQRKQEFKLPAIAIRKNSNFVI